jgi:hypothetical protein
MAEPCYGDPQFLVLHFLDGKLWSTKVAKNWRGAQMSKRNFERLVSHYGDRVMVKILPLRAILEMRGLEAEESRLSDGDLASLKLMGITT